MQFGYGIKLEIKLIDLYCFEGIIVNIFTVNYDRLKPYYILKTKEIKVVLKVS